MAAIRISVSANCNLEIALEDVGEVYMLQTSNDGNQVEWEIIDLINDVPVDANTVERI